MSDFLAGRKDLESGTENCDFDSDFDDEDYTYDEDEKDTGMGMDKKAVSSSKVSQSPDVVSSSEISDSEDSRSSTTKIRNIKFTSSSNISSFIPY